MKAKRENYVKPLSNVIETEQALMAIGSAESSVNIGISGKAKTSPALAAFAAMRIMRKRTTGISKKEVLCKIGIVVQF